MARREDRNFAFQLIFQIEFDKGISPDEKFSLFDSELLSEGEVDKKFVKSMFINVFEKLAEVDELIKKHTQGWIIERISKPDLAVLRMAVYELCFTDISQKIAVNEAVVLAKKYSPDDSGSFVNGVLAKVIKSRPEK